MSTTFFKNFFELLFFLALRISNNYITKNILTMQPLILIFLLYFFFISLSLYGATLSVYGGFFYV